MKHYVIRGGVEGKKRLALLSRALWPTTSRLLQNAGLEAGMSCLDLGCGGGDVSLELATWVGPGGKVVGIDMDEEKLELAREHARERGLHNLEFRREDADTWAEVGTYDFVYCRFLLTHLREPQPVVGKIWQALRPGGRAAIEDIEFYGHFCFPESEAFLRYQQLYRIVVARRGGNADIGPTLLYRAQKAGWRNLEVEVVQPAFFKGESKTIALVTLENIADTLLAEKLVSEDELESILERLRRFTENENTLLSLPRIFQIHGRKEPA